MMPSGKVSAHFRALQEELNSRSGVVRGFVLLAFFGVILLLWVLLFFVPVHVDKSKQEVLCLAKTKQLSELSLVAEKLLQQHQSLAGSDYQQKATELIKAIQKLDQQFDAHIVSFMTEADLSALLKRSALETPEINPENIEKLPTVQFGGALVQGKADDIFEHGFVVTLTGNFFATVHYLERLESSNQRFFIRSFEYTVTDYPKAQIVLSSYTLAHELRKKDA